MSKSTLPCLAILLALLLAGPAALLRSEEAEPDSLALAHALDSGKKAERLAAVRSATALGPERAVAFLRPVLTADPDREVRLEAVKALRALPGEEAVALLGEGLSDADLYVRKAAVEALRRHPEASAVAQLCRALQDKRPELRAAALLALGSRLAASQADKVLPGLEDRDASVREATIYALGATGGDAAVEALAGVVSGNYHKKHKALAAESLGAMGNRAALPALVTALAEADKDLLRPALESAIKKILTQTPARLKEEGRAPAQLPEPAPAVAGRPAAPSKPAARPEPAPTVSEAKAKPVDFKIKAPQARNVYLTGNFPGGKSKPMVRDVSGSWSVTLPLAPGSYRYRFIVDGKPTTDPENATVERGSSVITVP